MSDEVPVNETTDSASAGQIPELAIDTIVPQVSAGAQLATLREARGWTTAQIASQLNLANRQIQALEADNYAALPGMVIVRGFIRAYAKVLQTDSTPILAAIVDDTVAPTVLLPERNALSASFSETKLSPSGSRGFSFKLMIAVAVLAVIGVAVFAAQHLGVIPSSSLQTSKVEEKLAPIETGEIVEVTPEQAEIIDATIAPKTNESSGANVTSTAVKPSMAEPIAPVVEAKPAVVESKPVVVASVTPAPVVPAPLASPKPVVPAPAVSTAPVPAVAVSVNSKNALAIKVREDSWVEIKRADNSVLISRLLKAGTSEVVAVTEPVSMVIGNAAGVDVTLRGKSVDVVTGNASNVARLNLK